MNILIASPTTAVTMVNILKEEFAKAGYGTIAAADRNITPALYAADKAYIVPPIDDATYIPRLLDICQKEQVKAVLTMTDESVLVISKAAEEFTKIGVLPIVVDYEVAQICDNKHSMYKFMVDNGFKCAVTHVCLEEFERAYDTGEIDFPVFIKPIIGSGSRGAMKCDNMEELRLFFALKSNLIVQQYLDGTEYDIDAYIDTVSGKMVSIFAKEKIIKMAGTATGVSVKDARMLSLIERLILSLGALGPLNIEVFQVDGDYYVGEVNPRFGYSYMFAHACGVDFGKLLINNIDGIVNNPDIGNYESGILLMKYDDMFFRKEDELLA